LFKNNDINTISQNKLTNLTGLSRVWWWG